MSEWAFYHLRDVDRRLRARLIAEADGRSLSELIRAILCEHYEIEWEPQEFTARKKLHGTEVLLLRLQPALHEAIKVNSEESGESMKELILEALEAHYEEGVTA